MSKENKDTIIPVDLRETTLQDMARYSLYILYNRYVPNIKDGLKPVQRRILTSMFFNIKCLSSQSKRKSASTVGDVMGKYHPHGDSGIYDTFKPLANWFECKEPLICYESNSGSIQGGDHAAMRYTETYLSKFAIDCVIGDLAEFKQIVDWNPTFDRRDKEPDYLPVKVPLLLVNGVFAIAIGRRIEIPHHNLADVIDATVALLDNPKAKVILIPDQCQACEIVDTDWKKISNLGYGYFTVRGKTKITHYKDGTESIHILSVPDLIFSDTVKSEIEELIKKKILVQIADIQDHTTKDNQLDLEIILKYGADVNYVRQVLYKNTSLQVNKRVNMEVVNGTEIQRLSYKAYLEYFLQDRKVEIFRKYNFRLQKVKTKIHPLECYIKVLESGDVDNIIRMIRKQDTMDESVLVNWLMKKLDMTDMQAKFIIDTRLKALSKGQLSFYKEKIIELKQEADYCIQMITNPILIQQEIRDELLRIKTEYGRPRMCTIISEAAASEIPEGIFKIVITENNFIKKMQVDEKINTIRGDVAKFVLTADNAKDILLFDCMGKVFRLPVCKIAFVDKNSPGTDIRLLIKKCTSNIISVMYHPLIEDLAGKVLKYYLMVISRNGLIKRIDLNDIINATPSGIIYSRVNQGDQIKDVVPVSANSDIVVYTKSKALRIPIDGTPYLKRTTLGNQVMKGNELIDGISVITQDTTDIIVVTEKGRFNRFSAAALPQSDRTKAGNKVIKLKRGDSIKAIFSCNTNHIIRVIRSDEIIDFRVTDIAIGSSISEGIKLCKDGIIKAELLTVVG